MSKPATPTPTKKPRHPPPLGTREHMKRIALLPKRPKLTSKRIMGLVTLLDHFDQQLFKDLTTKQRRQLTTSRQWVREMDQWYRQREGGANGP